MDSLSPVWVYNNNASKIIIILYPTSLGLSETVAGRPHRIPAATGGKFPRPDWLRKKGLMPNRKIPMIMIRRHNGVPGNL